MLGLIPERSAGDILAGRTWLALGARVVEMPALTIDASERWLASIDGELADILGGLESAGDNLPRILEILTGAPDRLLDLLYAYDVTGVLPPREELRATATKSQLLAAVLGVWTTENPLLGLALTGTIQPTLGTAPSPPMNTSPPPTAGRRRKSASH